MGFCRFGFRDCSCCCEEEKRYGGRKLERPASEMRDRRPLKNLKKAWMEHTDDFDEVDDFYEH